MKPKYKHFEFSRHVYFPVFRRVKWVRVVRKLILSLEKLLTAPRGPRLTAPGSPKMGRQEPVYQNEYLPLYVAGATKVGANQQPYIPVTFIGSVYTNEVSLVSPRTGCSVG